MTLEKLLKDHYYLVYPDGAPVGIDINSGYPFKTVWPSGVRYWSADEYQHILSYAKTFRSETYGGPLRIRRIHAVETSAVMELDL